MERKEVLAVVIRCVGVPKCALSEETSLVNDLDFDSLDVSDVIMNIEGEFSGKGKDFFNIPDRDIDRLKTIGQITDYVFEKLQKKRSGAEILVPV